MDHARYEQADNDDYLKSEAYEAELGLGGARAPVGGADAPPVAGVTLREEQRAAEALRALTPALWQEGLTRDDLRLMAPHLPTAVYMRLPDSKKFTSAREALRQAGLSESRAEGDFMGADPDYPAEAALEDGGPAGWGERDVLFAPNAEIDGGSAEDTRGLLPGATDGRSPASR